MTKYQTTKIAVIGGGPKAAALAAKASALNQAGRADIQLTIFERREIGAHWTGRGGYTNGGQRLCTPIERDVGFPYASEGGSSDKVNEVMQHEFSWTRFLTEDPDAYREWVDAGRQPPTHADFARYLKWVVRRSSAASKEIVEVSRLCAVPGAKWQVQRLNGKVHVDASKYGTLFDAVVVTSPGPAKHLKGYKPLSHFDGSDFWQRLREVKSKLKLKSAEVVIIGGGGTAAAIVAWLVRNDIASRKITIIGGQASLFTRGDSVFENRLFTDPLLWRAMSLDGRKEVFNRLNRGVVWGTVMEEISRSQGLTFFPGYAQKIKTKSGVTHVEVLNGNSDLVDVPCHVLIDASGFEPWWFLDLIPGGKLMSRKMRLALERNMSSDLRLCSASWTWPRLHAPGLSSTRGPGLGNLMAMGQMSDSVFEDYVAP